MNPHSQIASSMARQTGGKLSTAAAQLPMLNAGLTASLHDYPFVDVKESDHLRRSRHVIAPPLHLEDIVKIPQRINVICAANQTAWPHRARFFLKGLVAPPPPPPPNPPPPTPLPSGPRRPPICPALEQAFRLPRG